MVWLFCIFNHLVRTSIRYSGNGKLVLWIYVMFAFSWNELYVIFLNVYMGYILVGLGWRSHGVGYNFFHIWIYTCLNVYTWLYGPIQNQILCFLLFCTWLWKGHSLGVNLTTILLILVEQYHIHYIEDLNLYIA